MNAMLDIYAYSRTESYLRAGDRCIRPGGCAGVLKDIKTVNSSCRSGREDWLMCSHCNARYKPVPGRGYVWADAAYYGYNIQYVDRASQDVQDDIDW
jgi:hypothetical protein